MGKRNNLERCRRRDATFVTKSSHFTHLLYEEIELLFESSEPIDLDELNVKLSDRGYTARSLVHDIAEALYKAGGGQ